MLLPQENTAEELYKAAGELMSNGAFVTAIIGLILGLTLFSLILILTRDELPKHKAGRLLRLPPGSKILWVVEFFFSPKTVEQTFLPLVTDMRIEYFDAMSRGEKWKARWIRAHYTYRAITAMGLSKAWGLVKMFLPSGKSERTDK